MSASEQSTDNAHCRCFAMTSTRTRSLQLHQHHITHYKVKRRLQQRLNNFNSQLRISPSIYDTRPHLLALNDTSIQFSKFKSIWVFICRSNSLGGVFARGQAGLSGDSYGESFDIRSRYQHQRRRASSRSRGHRTSSRGRNSLPICVRKNRFTSTYVSY